MFVSAFVHLYRYEVRPQLECPCLSRSGSRCLMIMIGYKPSEAYSSFGCCLGRPLASKLLGQELPKVEILQKLFCDENCYLCYLASVEGTLPIDCKHHAGSSR